MYVSNRKNGYKVVRRQKNGKVKLLAAHGTEFKTTEAKLAANGYKFTDHKPRTYC